MEIIDSFFPHALIDLDELYQWERGLLSHIIQHSVDSKLQDDPQGNIPHICLLLQSMGLKPEDIIQQMKE